MNGKGPEGETACIGAGILSNVTLTPPREVENGTDEASAKVAPVNDPKIETSEPGATALPRPDESLAKLAAFNTPPGATLGA
jgi:hypothetical protein